jgi:hypothetical protein
MTRPAAVTVVVIGATVPVLRPDGLEDSGGPW